MRIDILWDDKLIERAPKITSIKNKREVVQVALQTLILLHEQGEVRNLRSKLKWGSSFHELRLSRMGK